MDIRHRGQHPGRRAPDRPRRDRRRDPSHGRRSRDRRWEHSRRRIEDPPRSPIPNVVKVVTDLRGDAIYFSRSPIPYVRGEADAVGAAFQAHRPVRLPAGFPAGLFRSAGGSAGTGGAAGAVARARKRATDSRGGNGIRITGRGHAGGPGAGIATLFEASMYERETSMAKYIFVTGGVVSSLGKGHRRRVDRLPAGEPRAEGHAARSSTRT